MATWYRDVCGALGLHKVRTGRRAFRPWMMDARLEGRDLLSSLPAAPSADEQYMLQLINRARANPQVEAQRLLDLAGTDPVLRDAVKMADLPAFRREIDAAGASPPLAFNTRLIAAARDRNAAMVATNDQKHAPGGFLVDPALGLLAGDNQPYYPVGDAAWATGENLFAYSHNVTSTRLSDYVDYFHAAFLIDWGNPDFGHLDNVLAPGPGEASQVGKVAFSEIGIGLLSDAVPGSPPPANPTKTANLGLNVGPVLVAQEFAWKSGDAFLTGAIYRDGDGNQFYTPGEGLGGITVEATGLSGEGTYRVQTWDSGGYSLPLPPGRYAVTASGPAFSTRTMTTRIDRDNVGWDVLVAPSKDADQPVVADFDGDGRSDVAVYRASTGEWFIRGSLSGMQRVVFGLPGVDIPVPADYDGDGKADVAVYRPTTGEWFFQGSAGTLRTVVHGIPGRDNPVPADYDGDGKADLAVYEPGTARWSILNSSSGSATTLNYGLPGVDVPVPADFDGDGRADVAVYRPTDASWAILGSASPARTLSYGLPGVDVPVPADYDGDGRADVAVYRPTSGQWFLLNSGGPQTETTHGAPRTQVPVPADFDGDGRADLAVYRPDNAVWSLLGTAQGATSLAFGQPGFGRATPGLDPQSVANYGAGSARWTASPPPPAPPTAKPPAVSVSSPSPSPSPSPSSVRASTPPTNEAPPKKLSRKARRAARLRRLRATRTLT